MILIDEEVIDAVLAAYRKINETGLKPSVCVDVQTAFYVLEDAAKKAERVKTIEWYQWRIPHRAKSCQWIDTTKGWYDQENGNPDYQFRVLKVLVPND